jgi:hypothetical protein
MTRKEGKTPSVLKSGWLCNFMHAAFTNGSLSSSIYINSFLFLICCIDLGIWPDKDLAQLKALLNK